MNFLFFLFLAIILFFAHVLGKISSKFKMPAVLGELIAGILLGPSVLNLINLSNTAGDYINMSAELGVVLLMFTAGLETELKDLMENLFASIVVAILGIVVPLFSGAAAYALYFGQMPTSFDVALEVLFVGVVLTATSVGITVEVLREMGKLKSRVATTIMGAAVIDDILGVVVLSVVTSLKVPGTSISNVLLHILAFSVVIGILLFSLDYIEEHTRGFVERHQIFFIRQESAVVLAWAFCFFLAWASEAIFEVADITGAYFCGLMLSRLDHANYVLQHSKLPLELFFAPIFFVSVGLKVALGGMTASLWIFALILSVIAALSKVVGCGLGAKMAHYSTKDSLRIGVGMMARGEVALIMAQKGLGAGLLSEELFAPLILVVLITTLIAPIVLSVIMKDSYEKNEDSDAFVI